jgi:VanZ family protein
VQGERDTVRILRLLLAGYLGLLIYAGLMPMKFRPRPDALFEELRNAVQRQPFGPLPVEAHDVWTNIWVFLPLGLLAAGAVARRRWRAIPLAGFLAAACSGIIEIGQLALDGRVCSLTDFVLNVSAATAASAAGLAIFSPRRLAEGEQALQRISGRHGYVAALALAVGVLAETAWPIATGGVDGAMALGRVQWSILAGLAENPWHKWVIRVGAVYAVMTILLTGPARPQRRMQAAAWRAAVCVTALAAVAQLLRLAAPTGGPNLAYVLVAALAAGGSALAAPRLRSRRIELPTAVAVSLAGAAALLAYIHWLSEGGSAPYSIWKLYASDSGWQGFRLLRHMSLVAALSFMTSLLLSLRVRWSLSRRAWAGMLTGFVAGLAVRAIAKLLWHDPSELVNIHALASYVETLVAAGAAAALFTAAWPVLDRRSRQGEAQPVYTGPERRRR